MSQVYTGGLGCGQKHGQIEHGHDGSHRAAVGHERGRLVVTNRSNNLGMHAIELVQQRQLVCSGDIDYGSVRVRQPPMTEDLDGEN